MRYLSSLLLFSSSPLTVFAGGWWLDQSCTNQPNAAKIAEAMTEAFNVATDTYNIYFNTDNVRGDMDADEQRLFDLLIGGDEGRGVEAGDSFSGVRDLSHQETNENNAELKIYCDLNWLREIKINNQPFFKSISGKIALKKEKVLCDAAQAWTFASSQDTPFNIIQICPWFVEKINDNIVPQQDRGLGKWYKRWIKLGTKLRIYKGTAQIDAAAFPYTTFLHELMHTTQGRNRDDTGGLIGSYMWHNVVKLGAKPNNYQNADNLMYFALAMQLKREQGLITQNDGTLVQAPTPPANS